MKKYLPLFAAAVFAAALSFAGPITTWVTGDTITASDLSANFTHLHGTMVGGHGPRLVNADVSASAAISHSKLATPSLVPKAWADVTPCAVAGCTVRVGSGVSSVTRTDAGVYSVALSVTRANSSYAATVTNIGGNPFAFCAVTSRSTSTTGVSCVEVVTDGGVVGYTDSSFSYVLMDDNN